MGRSDWLRIPYRVRRNKYDVILELQIADFSRPRVLSVTITLADGEDAPMTQTVDSAVVRRYADKIDQLAEAAYGQFMERISLGTVEAGTAAEWLKRTRPRIEVTDKVLREVAKVYRDAEGRGDPPRQAVATHYDKTPERASQLIRRARDAGYLPDTTDADKRKGRKR